MDPVPPPFRPTSEQVVELVTNHPLAWVVAEPLSALLLPIRPVTGPSGELTELIGHFPRSSPMLRRLRERPRGLLLFMGAAAYISPSWLQNRAQAPTWASISAAFECDFAFDESGEALRANLADLIDAIESGRPRPWSLEELGERYEALARGIIAFRARIVGTRAAFRLGQDEDAGSFADIVKGLAAEGKPELAAMMEVNRDRSGKPGLS